MAYTKQTFTAGQTLKASDLNTMSQGIKDLDDGKQAKLVSGASLKTVNGISLLGSGDVTVSGGGTIDTSGLQEKLVSGTNIKTLNGQSLLGGGDIEIATGSGGSNQTIIVNVKDFGAVGDGVTDDSEAIQSALDYSRDNGGIVYFPQGIYYLVKKNHTVNASDMGLKVYDCQTLIGNNATLMVASDAEFRNTMTLYNDADATGYDGIKNVHLEGLTFDSAREQNHTHLRTTHSTNVVIKNCTFKNCYGWHNIECNSSRLTKIVGCSFYDYISATDISEHIQLDAATSNGNLGVSDSTVCKDIEISNCYFKVTNHPAIANHLATNHSQVRIHNNVFEGGTSTRGYIDFYTGMQSCHIYENTFYGGVYGVKIATDCNNNLVHDNEFVTVVTPVNNRVTAYNNVINGQWTGGNSNDSDGEEEVLYTLEDFEAGFVNKDSGKVETNSSFPNAIVSPLIMLEKGVSYRFANDLNSPTAANDEGYRIRIYDVNGGFKLAVDGLNLDNSYVSIAMLEGTNVYLSKDIRITPKQDCAIRLNFLNSTLVTFAALTK